jgi:WS/DGAT/MGAT family acyltransferase
MVVVRDRADGDTAVLSMVHHAMIDGVSGVDLMLVTHDLTPDADPPGPPEPWQPAPLPDPLSQLQDAVRDQLVGQAERWTTETFERFRPQEAAARAERINNAMAASMPGILQPAPRMPFNGTVTLGRSVAWAQFSFAEVRAIRSVLGGTVNDVVLAVIAGALGRYLRSHNIVINNLELRAMCPVSMRRPEGHGELGNQVSMMIAPLFVGILDPVERLRAERSAMERLKEHDQAGGFYAMTSQGNVAPPWVQAWAGQFEAPNTLLNTVCTNIPGPQVPLYFSGQKLLATFGFGMLSANIGLFNAITSYNQVLSIGATADPTMVPDIWFYAECLDASFAELREGAEREAAAAGVPSPSATAAQVAAIIGRQSNGRRKQRTAEAAAAHR